LGFFFFIQVTILAQFLRLLESVIKIKIIMTDSEKIKAIKQIIETRHFNDFKVAMDSLSDIIHIVYGIPIENSSQDDQN